MSEPWLAMAAEKRASWSGVTSSLNCPIAVMAVNDGSVQPDTSGSTLGTTGSGIDNGLFMPNWLEYWRSSGAVTLMPRAPNAVLQDCQNAWMIGGCPSPQVSPPSLTRWLVPLGSVSTGGAGTGVCGLATLPSENAAELVTILKDEPGGYVCWIARFRSG